MQGTHLEIYWCRVGEDRLPRRGPQGRRVLFVGGRRLLASRGMQDPEDLCFKGLDGFRCRAELVGTATYGGEIVKKSYPLAYIAQRFPGHQCDWGVQRLMRFAIEDSLPAGKYSVKFIRNDGETLTIDDVVVPAVAEPIAGLRREPNPVVLSPGQTLEGVSIDLTHRLSATAITLAPGCRLRDVQIINPYGVAFGGPGAENISIEHVDARAYHVSEITLAKPVSRVLANQVRCLGEGGFSAGDFGHLFSGSDCLAYRTSTKGYNRGPMHFPRLSELARNIYCEVTLEDILPSWSESEGFLWENGECEFPEVFASTERQVIVGLKSGLAPRFASKSSHVANIKTEEYARIIDSQRSADGKWLLTLDRNVGFMTTGECRVGQLAVDNVLIRCRGRNVKHLASIAGGCADHSYIDCRAENAEEFISVVKSPNSSPRQDYPPAVDHAFEWRPTYIFNSKHRCNRGYYVQPGSQRVPPGGVNGIGAAVDREFIHGVKPVGMRE